MFKVSFPCLELFFLIQKIYSQITKFIVFMLNSSIIEKKTWTGESNSSLFLGRDGDELSSLGSMSQK